MAGHPTGSAADYYSADTDDLDAFVDHGSELQRRLARVHETLARQRNFLLGAPLPDVVTPSAIPTLDDTAVRMADLDRFVDDVSTTLKQGTDLGRGVFTAPASRIDAWLDRTHQRELDELESALLTEGLDPQQAAGLRSAIETLTVEARRFELDGITIAEPDDLASALIANVEARATALLDANRQTTGALHATPTLSIERLAAELHFTAFDDPLLPPNLLTDELGAKLDDDHYRRLLDELAQLHHNERRANSSLAAAVPHGQRLDADIGDLTGQARALYDDNRVGGPFGRDDRLDDAELAHQLQQVADDDPGRAVGIKWLLDRLLTPHERADLNRILATGGSFNDRVGLAAGHPIEGAVGAAKGTWNDNAGWLVDGWADAQVAITNGLYGMAMHATPSDGDEIARSLPRGPADWDENDQIVELEFTIDGLAQRGGADLAFAVEVASAGVSVGKGGITLVRVGRRFFLRSGDVVTEVGPTLARQLDDATPDPAPVPAAGPGETRLREADFTPAYAPGRIEHALDGEVTKAGFGSGGHYRRSHNIRIAEGLGSDANDVLKARIAIWDPTTVTWVPKRIPSTFFPRHWTRRRTTMEIQEAFKNSHPEFDDDAPDQLPVYWTGMTTEGIKIKGRYKVPGDSTKGWASAFPLYEGD